MSAELKALIIRQARAEGFADARVTVPNAVPQAAGRLAEYLAHGRHGQMQWMAERTAWRGNPAALWPEARSVLMLAETYTPETDPLAILKQPEKGAISVYAQGRDYHDVVKKRLKSLGRWMIETVRKGGYRDADTGKWVKLPVAAQVGTPEIKVFVDTAPVMEKPLAAAAGLGWQGKHTNLLSRELGNWFFLGAIFTTLDLPPDPPAEEHCGTCTACLDICPTGAFPAPFQLDARRCISYLTIEHAGPVDLELRAKMGNRIYGCDDCLAICPWNKFARAGRDARLEAREDLLAPDLSALSRLDDTAFRDRFSGSPVKRIGRDRFVRNVLYAIGNSGLPALLPDAEALTDDPDETVRDAARWAVERLRRI